MVTTQEAPVLTINPADLGSLEMDGLWVPYVDLYDEPFVPTHIRLGADEYVFHSSVPVRGHGAILPPRIRELRAAGKKTLVVERRDRYYLFIA